MPAANAFGAVVTFVYAIEVIPSVSGPGGVHAQRQLNLKVFVAYLVTSLIIGGLWSLLLFRTTLSWLLADRYPTESERRVALRQPGRQLVVHGVLWAAGVVPFLALNADYSWVVARDAALATALGGLSICTIGYLVAERLLRPVTTMALTRRGPERPAGPGVMARVVLAWGFGADVPLLGAGLAVWIRGASADLARDGPALSVVGAELLVGLVSMLLLARSIAAPATSVRMAVRGVERGDTSIEVPVFPPRRRSRPAAARCQRDGRRAARVRPDPGHLRSAGRYRRRPTGAAAWGTGCSGTRPWPTPRSGSTPVRWPPSSPSTSTV